MTPTPKLRFVERVTSKSAVDGTVRTVRVLQQWWAAQGASYNEVKYELNGEWHDVRLEKEHES
jgi:hypothetical protein